MRLIRFYLRRSYTFLTPPGHLDVPKHSPLSTTRTAAAKRTCAQKEAQQWQPHPIKTIPASFRTYSANVQRKFLQFSAEHAPQRAPKTENEALFGYKRVEKNTRPTVYGHYRQETGHSTNQTNKMDIGPDLVPFFQRAEPFNATFEHHIGLRGANSCFEEG